MSKADKKHRHEAKRKAKRLAKRRREAVSPVKRLAQASGDIECWMSEDFQSMGQLQLFAYKRAAGLAGIACFLVDRGVVGLKDTWARTGVERSAFDDMLAQCNNRGIRMRRATIDEVRRWVAGGLRWARENGMRLPNNWERTVLLIGGVGDWPSADVSAFVKEFAGHPDDLRQRLIGEPFDTYLQRTDIAFVFSTDVTYMDQRTGEYIDPAGVGDDDDDVDDLDEDELESIAADVPVEELNALADRLAPTALALTEETMRWLAARGQAASTELFEAWRSVMLASMLSKAAMPNADEEDVADFGFDLLEGMANRIDASCAAEHHQAVGQVLAHLETNSLMMQQAVLKHGLAGQPGDQGENVQDRTT